MKKIIEVKNLYKLYRVGDSTVRALNGVNFEIYEGEFCAIVGTSGSGKSTLLNMLAGLEKPTKGEVIIGGQHMETLNEEGLVKFRRENIGFIFSVVSFARDDECVGKCGASAEFSRRIPCKQIKKGRSNVRSCEVEKT